MAVLFSGANNEQISGCFFIHRLDPAEKYPPVELMHGGPHTINRYSGVTV